MIRVLSPDHPDPEILREAGEILRHGGLVAFPTETVYGLGADALNADAARRIYEAKGRPSDNPLIVHIARMADLEVIAREIPAEARQLAARCWPGPLTLVLKKTDRVPASTTGGLSTVAVRFPSDPIARALIAEAGGFVAAPSANRSGRPSPTTAAHVEEDLGDRVDLILDGGAATIGLESTIVDCTDVAPTLLRPGYYSREELSQLVGEVRLDPALADGREPSGPPRAPGMRYRHYAPRAELVLVENSQTAGAIIRERAAADLQAGLRVGILCAEEHADDYPEGEVRSLGLLSDETELAHRLYASLRAFDADGVDRIYTETFDTPKLGEAIMDRLRRAAGQPKP